MNINKACGARPHEVRPKLSTGGDRVSSSLRAGLRLAITFFAFVLLFSPRYAAAQKITAEDIVAKHIASIGKPEDRAKMFNLTAVGDVTYSKSTNNKEAYPGKAVFAAEGNKSLFAMSFPANYGGEKISFDGKDARIAFSQPGRRSILGDYFFRFDIILKHGLLGGVLSKGWSLYDVDSHNARVSYDGTKKIDGKDVYVLSYEPKKGSDIRIKLYFEQDTFRHIRTEYRRTNMPGASNNPNTSSGLADTHEDLTEDFSDFKTEYGVTLPRTYKIHLFADLNRQSYENYYTCKFTDLYYNSKLDPNTFNIEAGK